MFSWFILTLWKLQWFFSEYRYSYIGTLVKNESRKKQNRIAHVE
jgi:hypothetical protein